MLYFCHVYLSISNCPMVIAVVLYAVLSCASAPIDDLPSCSTVNVAKTVNCCCQVKNSSIPVNIVTAGSYLIQFLNELSNPGTVSENLIIK